MPEIELNGAGYALPTGTRLRAALGTAFKEPRFDENFSTVYTRGDPCSNGTAWSSPTIARMSAVAPSSEVPIACSR